MLAQSASINAGPSPLIQQQSIVSVIRNTFAIYGKGFSNFLICLLPTLPFAIWAQESLASHAMAQYWIAASFSMFLAWLAFGAISISVSDICLGHAPSLTRSYDKLFGGAAGTLLIVNILQLLIVVGGLILFIIPGIIASLWLLFISPVVVLEGIGGINALKRSKAIAQGYNLRNLGVLVLLTIISALCGGILGYLFGLLFPMAVDHWPCRLFVSVVGLLAQPISLIAVVLLYYDLRARKESYDAAALAQDLKR